MYLYLAQHAQALAKHEDPTRPLSPQGREDAVRTAGFLSLFERPRPARIVHSDALRSQQTAAMFAEAWNCPTLEASQDLAPLSPPEVWQQRLLESHDDLMLVGHLPHLDQLVSLLLCQDKQRQAVQFRNAGVCCLQRNESQWQLCWHIHPQLFYPQDTPLADT